VGMASVTRIPYGMDEFTAAGGLRGEPIPMVKCETVDLEVPADAEIVIEGRLPTRRERPYEPEAPFGEYPGYQGFGTFAPVYEITCITHRNKPIYQGFLSQLAPSESSKVRHIAHEAAYMRELKAMGIEGVVDVHNPEMTQGAVVIVSIKKSNDGHPARVASALFSLFRGGKFVIITDDDVDIHDLDNLLWAMTFRTSMIPTRRKVYFAEGLPAKSADYASADSMEDAQRKDLKTIGCVVIDATRPFAPYPTVALPPAKYLQKARDAWEKTGLPPLEKSELPKCIVMEEEYLKTGKAANPAFLPLGPLK
ncbi:MAG: UbiD family decarboxylase, partial [Chloroflexi bacterium]|nr:UbiD family decarboxylase [Chloroflexota bacterium]